MPMDWDKLRIFHAVASVGSFTHAAEELGLSQSAVSRQMNTLEEDFNTVLFHRHARGIVLTEQGESLFRAVHEAEQGLRKAFAHISDSQDKPHGDLRLTTTFGIGTTWLVSRLGSFLDLYPDISLKVLLTDDELDLGMREADIALWLNEPQQAHLVRRRLFTVKTHLYASTDYLRRHGEPNSFEDLDRHRLLAYEGSSSHFMDLNALLCLGRDSKNPREAALSINNITALKRAVESSIGIGILPDYLVERGGGLIQLLLETTMPALECYLVYPEELKNVARIKAIRDFLVVSSRGWPY